MFDSEVSRTKERLAYFADIAGYELIATFIEEAQTWPAAFERLLQAVICDEIKVVILPSILHFAVLGAPNEIKAYFEAATGARVVSAVDSLSRSLGEAVS